MEAIRGTTSERRSVVGRWRALAVALTLVAALWAGFAVGRVSAPATQGSAGAIQRENGFADMPVVIPTGEPGRVWGHWDSAPRSRAAGQPRHHHRVKWGELPTGDHA
jgi:hypothetical protein